MKTIAQYETQVKDLFQEIQTLEHDSDWDEEEIRSLNQDIQELEGYAKIPYKSIDDQLKADILVEQWPKITLADIDKMVASL